ncbi:hypothetical protein HPB49_022646 [Dermacentor silvarum]|uniref:Uncharacterized protein n=1 Tax=Dermacentor silvarum TaxID=543639 RepID=A0ACB8CBQ7_DERSI|nr:hypothetical protein HPB49_022646 [Dermacentor silvarum]
MTHAGVPTEPSATTSEPCPTPLCSGPRCRGTKLGPNGCQVCDCDGPEQCPLVQCAPGCRAEETAPEGRCPTCVCNAAPTYSNREVDVPCFTPLLREALRRLAEVEEQLHQLRHLTQENGMRLHRLLPPAEHHPHHQPHHHQPHHPAPPHAGNPEALPQPAPAAPAGGDAQHANSTA